MRSLLPLLLPLAAALPAAAGPDVTIPVTARLDDVSNVLLVARVVDAELEVEAPRR